MSDDGELPESEGELVDSDGDGENNAPVDKEHAYTLFNKSNFNQVWVKFDIQNWSIIESFFRGNEVLILSSTTSRRSEISESGLSLFLF